MQAKTTFEEIGIRPYVPSDRKSVIGLLRMNTPAYFAPEEEEDLRRYLNHEAEHYFVAESPSGELMGGGGFNLTDDGAVARISWDIVHPDRQGRGIGHRLTEYRLTILREYPAVQTIVVRTSQLAFGFYEKFGFGLKEIEKDYWARGFDLYYMELPVRK